jgi:hypothetical protein
LGDFNYTVPYLSKLRSVLISISGRQKYYVDSPTLDAEECGDEEVVQAVSHASPGVVSLVA